VKDSAGYEMAPQVAGSLVLTHHLPPLKRWDNKSGEGAVKK